MGLFRKALVEELNKSQDNDFGIENYDEYRFGKFVKSEKSPLALFDSIKKLVKRLIGYDQSQKRKSFKLIIEKSIVELEKYESGLEYFYDRVNSTSKGLIVKIIAYRLLGFSKVKLPTNNDIYWESLDVVKKLKIGNERYDPHFMHIILDKFDLTPIGFNIILFFNNAGIVIDFLSEQYSYKFENKMIIHADKGDIVLDVGGCWGDTALYFADKVGENGKVYSFEFIPNNIKLHNINTDLNINLKKRIELVPNPASNVSDVPVYFKDNGPGSKIELNPFNEQTGITSTISIDDFVVRNKVSRVDFIKMDIEGAETFALEGAIETIKKFRPILAIAIYHSMDDFINIPKWILDLNLGYELFVGHYTIHSEETICFAKSYGK